MVLEISGLYPPLAANIHTTLTQLRHIFATALEVSDTGSLPRCLVGYMQMLYCIHFHFKGQRST